MIVMLPVGLAVASWFPVEPEKWGSLLGLGTVCGLTMLFSQLGRDQGRMKEGALFECWGGKPTTRFLSRVASPLNPHTLERYRMKLGELRGDLKLPTAEEESEAPGEAKAVYESCVDYLLERTRDRKAFPLIFSENVNYGFRRNLWGMKPAGMTIAMLAGSACLARVGMDWWQSRTVPGFSLLAAVVCVFFVVIWVGRITPNWVRLAGDAFAQRLLAAVEEL
jgi:hypothetical protein